MKHDMPCSLATVLPILCCIIDRGGEGGSRAAMTSLTDTLPYPHMSLHADSKGSVAFAIL